jgi:hypothetical protein
MQVLMPETASPQARLVAAELEAAGHEIWRCHDDPVGSPCRAIRGAPCPLDVAAIEVAVTARSSPTADVLPTEDGILCATRRRLPVVVAGATRGHPFRAAATVEAGTAGTADVVAAVATGVAPEHTAVATEALRRHLPAEHAGAARAVVRRRAGGGLRVTVSATPAVPRSALLGAATRVAAALRTFDPWSPSLDVSIEEDR